MTSDEENVKEKGGRQGLGAQFHLRGQTEVEKPKRAIFK